MALQESFSYSKWLSLAEITLTLIHVFNRRRAGEIQRILIEDFETYEKINKDMNSDIYNALSKADKEITEKYVRFLIHGKLGRTVPVLLSNELFQCVILILKLRKEANVLSQNPHIIGLVLIKRPIAYASRLLNAAEQNYSKIEKLLTIIYSVNYFHSSTPSRTLCLRWRLRLAEYEYNIIYKAGKTNLNADALSRNPTIFPTAEDNKKLNCHSTVVDDSDASIPDAPYQQILLNNFATRKDNLVILVIQRGESCDRKARMLANQERLPQIENATLGRAKLISDQNRYIIALVVKERISEIINNQIMVEVISSLLDVVNELALTSISICQGDVDRMPWNKRILKEYHDSTMGGPRAILTDQGSNFLSALMRVIARKFYITQFRTTAYHPQSNGSIERSHHVLWKYLYNTSVHEGTKFTPHELVFGRTTRIPTSDLVLPNNLNETYVDYLISLFNLRDVQEFARENFTRAKNGLKRYYDKKINSQTFKRGLFIEGTAKRKAVHRIA
ncbi:POL5 protein, partial [Pseudoatta argentina]